ncbi:MAG: hypothetical protein LUG16_06080 [Candidatus Gastranaerophilales bacterium]|nr:hypothetical protein [Candidatus Gastranaerophilales bacterium]
MNINGVQNLLSQYADYKENPTNYDDTPIFTIPNDDKSYSLVNTEDNIEDMITEFLNIENFDGVKIEKIDDDNYNFTYQVNGVTYTEAMTFNYDNIEITSTNDTNESVKKSKIKNGDDYTLVKYFDRENDGDIDATKRIDFDYGIYENVGRNPIIVTSSFRVSEDGDYFIDQNNNKSRSNIFDGFNTHLNDNIDNI